METVTSPVDGYAAALLDIFRAEGDAERLSGEFFQVAQALDSNTELRVALTDPQLPVERRQGIVDELLATRASPVTVAAVNLLVATGRARDLTAVASRLVETAAEEEGSVVAEVRAAIDLDPAQVARLEERLSAATGKRVQVTVIVDPSVVGGVVTKIGDTVFDGSVKSRLDELREQWG